MSIEKEDSQYAKSRSLSVVTMTFQNKYKTMVDMWVTIKQKLTFLVAHSQIYIYIYFITYRMLLKNLKYDNLQLINKRWIS